MERWVGLDRLRALAVVLMIQGHTFTALLRPGELQRGFARLHGLIHGLTGPAFLFGAGLSFAITTYPRYAQHRRFHTGVRKRLVRYALIFLLGYALQLPGGSIVRALHASGETLRLTVRVGPLQLIALLLAVCQLSVLVLRDRARHALLLGALGALVLLLSPAVYEADAGANLPALPRAFVDDRWGSQYPIFPNASYTLGGVACGYLLCERQALRGRALLWLGGTSSVLLYLAFQAGLFHYDARLFWRVGPPFMLFRLALVVAALGALQPAGSARPAVSSWAAILAQHSLVAYVAHLLLLYGTPFTPNLAHRFGGTLSLSACSVAAVLIVVLTVAIARAYQWLRAERQSAVRWVSAGLTLLGLVMLAR